jgi:ankyrin repeat protein
MVGLQSVPQELLNEIIEHLLVVIGIQKAVMLRTVHRSFNTAILEAICVSQVVDIFDPATPYLVNAMGSTLRGKIFAVKSLSTEATTKSYLSIIASVNHTLDRFVGETDEETTKRRHESVAQTVAPWGKEPGDPSLEAGAQNLLSGAIVIGNLPLVKELLESNESSPALADVNGSSPYFRRPLTLAAAWGHLEITQYLLDCGARPDLFTSRYPPGDDTKVDDKDWDPKDETRFSGLSSYRNSPLSALSAAVLGGYEDIVHLLLLPQYRLPSTKFEWLRALLAGARAGRLDLIQKIFETLGKSLSDYPGLGNEVIWEAIRSDRKEVVQMLLDNGVDVNAFFYPGNRRYCGTLQIAASTGNASMVRYLIERGAKVNFDGLNRAHNLPIEIAALCGHKEVVQLLLEQGADPSRAIRRAAKGGQPRIVKFLLDKYPDLPQREEGDVGRETLWNAMASKNLTAIDILVESGVSLNEGYEYEATLPINLAKQGYGTWVVEHLISLGAEDTKEVTYADKCPVTVGEVLVSERTWQWAGKY